MYILIPLRESNDKLKITLRSRCGRISQGELRKSNLVEVFNTVDEEEDINKVGFFKRESCLLARAHIFKSAAGIRYCLLIARRQTEQ